jgi:hypothetical protein
MESAASYRHELTELDRPLRPNPDVTLERAGREAILYDRQGRRAHVVNESAARLFELCDGTATLETVTEEFAAAYGLPVADVEGDVQAIVGTFRRLNVLL